VVLGTRDNIAIIKADVQHASCMSLEATNWSVIVLDIPDNAGIVRRPGDHNFIVKLEAQNRCSVVLFWSLLGIHDLSDRSGRRANGKKGRLSRRLLLHILNRTAVGDVCRGRPNNLTARPWVMSIPDADCPIAGASNDLVPRGK
jgi:hypothetical protein